MGGGIFFGLVHAHFFLVVWSYKAEVEEGRLLEKVDQVHYQSHQLRSIKAQVVIKATLFLTVMYLILEANQFHVNQPDCVNPPPSQPDQANQLYYSQLNCVNKVVKESHNPLKHIIITITIFKHICCQVSPKESLLRRNDQFV